ncbi:MAG: tetratricopeptide repeat protein [Pseudomonadota bacterium]
MRLTFPALLVATLMSASVSLVSVAQADTVAIETHEAEALAPPVEAQSATSLSGLFLAATLAETERDLPRAAEFYRGLHELDPSSSRFLQSAFTMELADGRMTGALDLASLLVAAGDTGVARLAIALDAMRQRSHRVALRELEAYQSDGFGDIVASLVGAWAHYGAGDAEQGLAILDAMDGPAWVELYASFHAGLIRLANGDSKEALADLERAYTADPGALRLVQGYARGLIANDRKDEALEVLEGFRMLAPSNEVIAGDIAAALADQPISMRVRTAQQGAAEVLYGLGVALGQDGAEEVGAIYLNLALFAAPEFDLARFGLARTYEGLELWERAVDVYEGITDESALKRTAEIRLGVLLDQLERPDEADAHLEALIEADSSDLNAISTFGTVLRVRRDFERAAEVYSMGIETIEKPTFEHWRLFYQRGIAFERTDRWPLAEADFLKALELNEDQPDVLNYLAYTWVDRGENLDRSVQMLERAVEMRPDSGYIVDSLGWVYFRLGRFEDAVEQLERAVILDPTQAVIHDHLGDAYWMVGRRLEARFQWSHARDLDDTHDEIDEEAIQRKLQRGLTRQEVESVGVWPEGYKIPTIQ